jgi:hypothetical protein
MSSIVLPFQSQSLYIIIPIALLYPLFFSKLFDLLFDANSINTMCDGLLDTKNYNAFNDCTKKRKDLKTNFNNDKYSFMLLSGLGGIVLGMYIAKYNNISTAGYAISTGGLMSIIMYTISNWYNMTDATKLGIIGLSIIILLYSSYKMVAHYSGTQMDITIRTGTPCSSTQN